MEGGRETYRDIKRGRGSKRQSLYVLRWIGKWLHQPSNRTRMMGPMAMQRAACCTALYVLHTGRLRTGARQARLGRDRCACAYQYTDKHTNKLMNPRDLLTTS